MWTGIFYVLTAMLSGLCALAALHSALSARAERESLHKRLRSVESRTESLGDSVEQLTSIVEKIAQSQKMQRVRTVTSHAARVGSSGEPDVRTEPEAWRAWQNSKLKTGVVN